MHKVQYMGAPHVAIQMEEVTGRVLTGDLVVKEISPISLQWPVDHQPFTCDGLRLCGVHESISRRRGRVRGSVAPQVQKRVAA